MIDRVRHPGAAPKDIDRGPATGRVHRDSWLAKLPIEDQLVLAAHKKPR